MTDQLTLATQVDGGFQADCKATRRDVFLAEMDKVVPWSLLRAVIEPFYPKPCADGCGRPAVGFGALAAHPLSAAVVRVERSGGGGSLVRLRVDAAVRGHRSGPRVGAG